MLYSLPTGKVIELSVEQYLDMSDEELEYLISINYGDSVENPFFGSILESSPASFELDIPVTKPIKPSDLAIEDIDESIDYTPEEE
jgi:hypothetical protein